MKYIIELPKEVKEKFDNATKDDIYGSYYDYNSVIGNAIKNGTPLEEMIDIKQYLKETNTVLLTEQAYEYLKKKASVIEKLEEIKTEMDIIAELEKIREEIQNLIDFNESCEGHTDLYQADELIKERIAKLKGEKE